MNQVDSASPPVESFLWVPPLELSLTFRMDTLAWLMTLIVSAVGALVLLYCAHYFEDRERSKGLGLFAGSLTAFAGAMLGLVTTDDLLLLYVFWELTTILSYLLIGYVMTSKASVAAAKQALIVTTFGGLAMLVGIIMIGQTQGTYLISEILGDPGSGPWITAGVVLLLVGAISKSALVPFHFWLPGAMAAPTPISAYLHAATMVKAGVYLVAALAPVFAGVLFWRETLTILGATTMILGGWRSLRQTDLKLLLAYGTVSQLGFVTMLVGIGTQAAGQAGLAMLLAHALFKAALFLTVGVVDVTTGTRDITKLTGLARRMPLLAVASGLAAASMAGLPPLLGFINKELLYEANLQAPRAATVVTVAGVASNIMLVAAAAIVGIRPFFGRRKDTPKEPHEAPVAFWLGPVILAGLGLEPFVMTTGSRGLHVVAPLDRTAPYEASRALAREIAEALAAEEPERYTVAMRKATRGERVFIDYVRNAYGQTAVAPYAVRARPGAPVATPLPWEELEDEALGPQSYTIDNLAERLEARGDPWREIDARAASLEAAAERWRAGGRARARGGEHGA